MDSLVTNLWWGHDVRERHIHWVSKDILRLPKARGAKQRWRIIQVPESLWAKVLKARYFPHCLFLEAKQGGRASWAWTSLL
ncbi:hypothetical protein DVH24_003002 [Malus domestica]|uniref:Reverse transcriptase zinc-binding domain-containing protein n=1 Tax=Malus domestica TaxID=3750 RepID=A0A498K9C7_MALDO|nr:hypothetical protein DVH24_003002 [Malus domestica]